MIDDVAGLLTWSRRTIIFAGAGAASARDDIVKLADRTGALLASSMQSRSLFRDHPRFIGIFGNFSTDQATELIAEADCVLALGVSLNTHQIGFAPSTRLVQVDIDPTRIGEYATPHISILADAGAAVRAIDGLLAQADAATESSLWEGPSYSERLEAARTPPALPAVEERTDGRLQLSIALDAIDRILPEDRLVVVDGGYFVPFVFDRIAIPDEGSWIWTIDFASIGLGLGISIGTTIARPERHVVLFVGDGGLSMSIQELETIVREEIKLIVVVLNDAAYHAEGLDLHGKSKELALFRDVDFAAVATAFGGQAVTMRGLDDTTTVDAAIAKHKHGLLLIDVKVVENEPHRLWMST